MEDKVSVKEICNALGITSEQLFKCAFDRFGLLYSIGGPEETHARYKRFGVIPIYVARYIRERERALARADA